MRSNLALGLAIVLGVSLAAVAPPAKATYTAFCKGETPCKTLKDLCRIEGGSYGGIDGTWGVCVFP